MIGVRVRDTVPEQGGADVAVEQGVLIGLHSASLVHQLQFGFDTQAIA